MSSTLASNKRQEESFLFRVLNFLHFVASAVKTLPRLSTGFSVMKNVWKSLKKKMTWDGYMYLDNCIKLVEIYSIRVLEENCNVPRITRELAPNQVSETIRCSN